MVITLDFQSSNEGSIPSIRSKCCSLEKGIVFVQRKKGLLVHESTTVYNTEELNLKLALSSIG